MIEDKGNLAVWRRLLAPLKDVASPLAEDDELLPAELERLDAEGLRRRVVRLEALARRLRQMVGDGVGDPDGQVGVFTTLANIREACGDRGTRMQPELVEYIRELKRKADQRDGLLAVLDEVADGCDEVGLSNTARAVRAAIVKETGKYTTPQGRGLEDESTGKDSGETEDRR